MTIEPVSVGEPQDHPFPKLMDLLGRRWVLRVLHELHAGPSGFRDLAARCGGMSSSVLSTRLTELRSAGIIEQTEGQRYSLTTRGRKLTMILMTLSAWAVEECEPPSERVGDRLAPPRSDRPV